MSLKKTKMVGTRPLILTVGAFFTCYSTMMTNWLIVFLLVLQHCLSDRIISVGHNSQGQLGIGNRVSHFEYSLLSSSGDFGSSWTLTSMCAGRAYGAFVLCM
jgi:hypothetical protein